jgi:hypothetical protein
MIHVNPPLSELFSHYHALLIKDSSEVIFDGDEITLEKEEVIRECFRNLDDFGL